MAKLVCITFLVAAAVCSINAGRIVGGQVTNIEEYPSIVQVESRTGILWNQVCAANILNSRHVLSAAHCFTGLFFNRRNRRIRAGTTRRGSGGVVITLARITNHPSYGSNGQDGDISVIRLDNALVYGPAIQAGAIVSQGFQMFDNLPVIHAGWGAVSSGGLSSSQLRDVQIFTINRQLCRQRYASLSRPQTISDNMICAGILDVGGKDACQGDSGGPLYYGDILIGIVSFGQSCADPRFPGVNTAVSSYTNWIVDTVSA
ncbi:trypsin, alkaline C-like [Trichoplusia ni]|uniref:Trypsin, alkaline C-like n=1 Tax=Trichoplusia ni TaxID=7111 RepID=A0A7E5W681_TRINI|nr:trypsin, alkaline C-like [Trichoplusia ni]